MKANDTSIGVKAPLDEGFRPMAIALRVQKESARTGQGATLAIAWERDGGCVARYDLALPSKDEDEHVFRLAERVVKFVLWAGGGWRLFLAGPDWLCRRIGADYAAGGHRTFDVNFMNRVYGRSVEVVTRRMEEMPGAKDATLTAGGHLDGCRLGFDLGASDYKVSAVNQGEVVFSEELHWTPGTQSDPDYHFNKLNEGLKLAAGHLPRVDAIGGSTAGLVVANRIMVASLFRSVPEARFGDARNIFLRIQKEWQVPVEVANDGDVTALAGALSMGVNAILGVALGSSEAGGYIDRGGHLTGRITELAFAPVDFNPAAAADEWSGDHGVGAMYFSQQAVNKLAPAAGFCFEAGMPLPERLKMVQERMKTGDERTRRLYETIGVYLGYTVPWYREFYDFDSMMILGRVTSGPGGDVIIATANEVLRKEFPEWADRVKVFMPDEKARRVGQSVAAASLPETGGGAG